MNKRIIAFFVLVFVTISGSQALSQSRCSLTEANAPTVRGLKLGLSADQVKALFPANTKRRKDERDAAENTRPAPGSSKTAAASDLEFLPFDPSIEAAKDQFAGVDSVSIGVYKGRVFDISVMYADAGWSSIDDWVAKVAETFKLPGAQAWMVGPSENPNKVLRCDGIEIEAGIQGGGASIRIRNTRALPGEERKRPDTRP